MPQKKPTPSQKCKETATGKKQARNPECNGKGQIEKQPWTKLSVKLIFIHKIYQLNIRVKTIGREEYVRVRLEEPPDGGLPLALPVYGKSGLLGPLIRGPRPPARGPRQRGVGLRDRSHGAALPHPLLRIRRMPTVI
mgnify:CR=1 FL=1